MADRLAARIKELRRLKKMTQNELGDLLGVGKTTISNYETGYSAPDNTTLLKLAEFFNVTVDYLFARSMSQEQELQAYSKRSVKVPLIKAINAGVPIFALKNTEEYIELPEEFAKNGEYFALRISDNGMNRAKLDDGDIVLVRQQERVENGEIAVVVVDNNEAVIKRFYQSGRFVTLSPDSYTLSHQPQTYDITKNDIKIQGKVVRAIISVV